jgi:hypothetical protein
MVVSQVTEKKRQNKTRSGLGWGPMAGISDHSNKILASLKSRNSPTSLLTIISKRKILYHVLTKLHIID